MKTRLRIGIVDLVARGPHPFHSVFARMMNANFAAIMPQVIAAWCEQLGHQVSLVCYTGFEDLQKELPGGLDLVFIGGFTESAQFAYALSNRFRSGGAITVLGGPHARCYPQDAAKYFDYVLGFTDKGLINDLLRDCAQHRPVGVCLSAPKQPSSLPGVRERWRFIEAALRKAPLIKAVSMISSTGCPYSCSFCVDSTVSYQPLELQVIKEDLRFLRTKFKRPLIGWHDPNFGVRFDEIIDAIEAAAPVGSFDFAAESTLSLLSEPRLVRLARNGFKALLPGIESWYGLGAKTKTGNATGREKVRQVADQVNTIMRHIPYVQTNFVLGLDCDEGPEPFELTKQFVDLAPGAFPGYSLLSAFGQAAPLNLEYQREGRVIPFPFHFLNNNAAMNVKPANYSWPDFYDKVIDLVRHAFSARRVFNRARANNSNLLRVMNLARTIDEGAGRLKHHSEIRRRLDADPEFRPFFEQQTTRLPRYYEERVRTELGPLLAWLPKGALDHDPNAWLNAAPPLAA